MELIENTSIDVSRIRFTLELKPRQAQNLDTIERVWVTMPSGERARFVRVTNWEGPTAT
jgi:hypothetical protein